MVVCVPAACLLLQQGGLVEPTNWFIHIQGLHVRLDMSTGQRMGKLMDPEESAADASTGQANASTGGEHVVILNDGGGAKESGRRKSRLRVAEEVAEPARTEAEVSTADARSPHETMEAVLLNLPAPERASMGIDAMHAVRYWVFCGWFAWTHACTCLCR